MTEKQTLTPIEAINEFYRLKNKYESVYYEKNVNPIVKSDKSKREKSIDYSKLPKHELIMLLEINLIHLLKKDYTKLKILNYKL